jgi:hypothetical protein
MAADSVQGIEVLGSEPKELKLSDGSRLRLETEPIQRGRVEWTRAGDGQQSDEEPLSVHEAIDLAGSDFASYVAVRTRAEAEWMRTVAEWYREQADALGSELAAAGRG